MAQRALLNAKKGSGLKIRMVGFFGIVLYPPFHIFLSLCKKGSGFKIRMVGFFGIIFFISYRYYSSKAL